MEKVKGPKLDKGERRKIGELSLLLISDSDSLEGVVNEFVGVG